MHYLDEGPTDAARDVAHARHANVELSLSRFYSQIWSQRAIAVSRPII